MESNYFAKKEINTKIIFISLSVISALFIRFFFLNYQSGDYIDFLSKWYDFIKFHGFINSFKYNFSNYTPLYLHFIAIFTLLPIHKLLAIKLISIFFDFITALFVYKFIKDKYKNFIYAISGFIILLYLPTVLLNGAFWGQCDIIYSCMILISVYYITKKKYNLAFIFWGISFALKMQAVFIFPLFVFLWLRKEFRIYYFIYIPFIYFLSISPSLLAGRPFIDLLRIYFSQGQKYVLLTLNAPNIYQFFSISDKYYSIIYTIGLVFTLCVIITLIFLLYKRFENKIISNKIIISISLLFVLVVPYFLPRMHERYFFPADILSVVFAFYFPKYFFVSVVIILSSFLSYFPYLFGVGQIFLIISACILLLIIIFIFYKLYKVKLKV